LPLKAWHKAEKYSKKSSGSNSNTRSIFRNTPLGLPCTRLDRPISNCWNPIATTPKPRWIAERGEGLFHICLEVEGIEEALDELRGKGVKLLDERPRIGHANSRIAFIDPESTGNVLIELVELPNPS
jgi:catechol 2,3-dioxygenase-like lactoylglutathione lyase family enzyme